MHCGFPGRTPPTRPAFTARLALLACLLVLSLGPAATPASAYVCAPPGANRTLQGHAAAQKDCYSQSTRPFRHRDADPMSFVFFIGILVAVVIVPVALGRREELPPE